MLVSGRTSRKQASFSLKNRLYRLIWKTVYLLLIEYTPVFMRGWRVNLYKLFGAKITGRVNIYPKAIIWSPSNLVMKEGSCIANGAIIYNQDLITLGKRALISQGAHICTGTHDYNSINFDLKTKPIEIKDDAWICAEAFICPGVKVGEGAVLGARAFTHQDLDSWCVYTGNPARKIRKRIRSIK
ncbi:MAG: putative colanic acid biosynthesis acetyltransferase [Pseudomonadota bacterium]|nr:putative colanic acid biosynthesis acetyltransferase [Pseudomonadota bacterium]